MEKKLNAYQQFQMEMYGNIIGDVGETNDEDLEGSAWTEAERFSEWMTENAEREVYGL